ncbi:protein translocase subunit SecF [Acinetobacter haemolyticus]|uniref:Protein-export membrane protein SecF n=1 Tax=Acinetobacter haemolyticus CIP 64.3 = MTCC 9819 TaxID=1217659 RepID=N9GHE9_ACIHA|nr:protein translocase subunit SecF [Acinetobacter haemolyticus]ENW16596.1 protein-export membrane protein SecF [Acinetobacter haemolyticus CIP 64.3 = MTCC 9819]EPR89107.1 Protein-export membrane protein SecF [Acinetobacter haemolyticus CIP 64.3 = MTCC 9819]NAS02762.1 protein translocase subunit SecF [Acinetobacter haemolyticus]NAS05962.1 protein translocase subunit SecF [Acinetobacter haemolyticus]QHI30532.1 protein translocase subunit SecF [Acinetobacter haemolyticus]
MTDLTQRDSKQYGRPDDLKIIPFMKIAKPAAIISILLTIASIFFIATKGLNLGLDFTGGVSAELNYQNPVQPSQVTQALSQAGFKDPVVQTLGSTTDLIVRMPVQDDLEVEDLSNSITKAVQLPNNTVNVHKVDAVGGAVGNELYVRSAGAVALALILMLIYVTIRFEFKLAMGAVMSLFHDIVIVLGMFALFQWPFDLTVLAALLAIIGFSLNDNIVVSDRIRENFRKIRGASSREIIDIALTETLRRTIHTSATLLLVVVAMFILGGDGLHWFSAAMIVGVFVGTYSSIYIGTAYALWRGLSRQDFIVQVKPEFEDDQIP